MTNGYNLLKLNEKLQNHILNNYILAIDHFLSLWSKKHKLSFSFMVNYCSQELHF